MNPNTGKPRPKGKCYLCGRMIWGAVAREGGMTRHPACKPNPSPGRRYGVTNQKGTRYGRKD